jgi:hypothetical protein
MFSKHGKAERHGTEMFDNERRRIIGLWAGVTSHNALMNSSSLVTMMSGDDDVW